MCYNGNNTIYINSIKGGLYMSLTRCPECGYDNLSTGASHCPNCGCNRKDKMDKKQMREKCKKEYMALYVNSFFIPLIGIIAYVVLITKGGKYNRYCASNCLVAIAPSIILLYFLCIKFFMSF